MSNYPTAHIDATPQDFAKTVLMPGDPLRAKFIAETYLTDVRLVNSVRSAYGYTGFYKGKQISVMTSGMGMPSMAIYSYELFNFFGVDNIIRVGSAGAIREDVKIRDIILAIGASTDSSYASQYNLNGTFSATASYSLLKTCADTADRMGFKFCVGNILSTDAFYRDDSALPGGGKTVERWGKMGVLAVEMEAAALYMNAARAGKNALAVCTVSDHILTGEETTAQERQNTFTDMIKLCLETAINL